jgi:ectoine hydroxylase-related dioxygenase (phytanoyl-CoA dioxygenase family)
MRSNPNPIELESFHSRSFVVLRHFLEPEARAAMRRACDAVLGSSRETCAETSHSTPRISLLTQANSFEHGTALLAPIVALAGSSRVCALLEAIRRGDETGAPQLKDAHYYHEQTKRDWDGDWHRDSQFARADPDLERQLITSSWSVHFRVAFEDDDRLEIVPASHARWDTDEELRIRRGACRASSEMPNATRISLRSGDACLFHAWSIHRATYRRAPVRRTLDLLYASAAASRTR